MEYLPGENETPKPSPELPARPADSVESGETEGIDALPERLGYGENAEMTEIRLKWVEATRLDRPEEVREQAAAYQERAEAADAARLEVFRHGRGLILGRLTEGEAATDELMGEAAELGFVETDEMRIARAQIALAQSQGSSIREGLTKYEHLANASEARFGAEFQIGLMIRKATVYRDAGRLDYYEEDLADAAMYASDMGLDWVVDQLEADTPEP